MIKYLTIVGLQIFLLGCFITSKAQKKDSTYVGAIEGVVKDSVHNYILRSATLSVYKAGDDKLISYQLSNNFGKFQFKELPVGVKLNILMSYVGYQVYKKEFVIPADSRVLDLKMLIAERAENNLEEVKIVAQKAPVEMKGDTLVFNADAFKLDTNATVEDLLRKLTGVTVWSDGLITVNGKKISNLYVEGKPFFGGDPKITIQNLPKNVVEKIQVYENRESSDKVNPDVDMNIVLKKDKKSGLFGKIGGGYGTDKRYAIDGMLNGYTPKTQVGIIGTHNNVNKTANSVQSLMANSSYKGEGTNNEYQSDFSQRGLNIFTSAGFTLAHEFGKPYRLNASYFFSNSDNDLKEQVHTVESLNDGNQLIRDNVGTSKNVNRSHNFNSSYNHSSDERDIVAGYNMRNSINNSINTQTAVGLNKSTGETSQNAARQENSGDQRTIDVNLKLSNKNSYLNSSNKQAKFDAQYAYSNTSGSNNSKRITDFSASDPSQNENFNRQYNSDFNNSAHSIDLTVPNVGPLSLKYVGVIMEFKNALKVNDNKETAEVGDLDNTVGYVKNSYLTNKSNYSTLSEKPAIGFSKSFIKYLDNRYHKTLSLNLFTEGEVFYQKNVSEKVFQRFSEFNFRFLPSAFVSYTHNKTSTFNRTYSLNYTTSANYPNVYQLAPLTDSSNVYFLHYGNANLKSDYKQRLEFSFVHYGTKVGSTGSVNLKFWISKIGNYIGDSSRYDALGRRIHYHVNLKGYHDAGYSANWQKAFKMKENLFEVMFTSELNYANTPAYINGDEVLQKNLTTHNWFRLSYNFNSLITVFGSQSLSTGTTKQEGNVNYSYKNFGTYGGMSVVWPKSLYWNTNVNFNRSTSDYSKPINFAIWNASIAYRFLKGENAEIKVSALDLLGQNKSIINYGYNNMISTGSVNVLQQYFMLTLAYYPRFFGSTEKKKP